jgi:hypothetical protein
MMCIEYAWRKTYSDAVLETDSGKLSKLISLAEKEIQVRLNNDSLELDDSEGKAIEQTLEALSVLKSERLS